MQIGLERPKELDVTITNSYGYPIGKKTIPIGDGKKDVPDGASVGDMRLFSNVDGEKAIFIGNGFGHGVGLSQWGARGMALQKGKKNNYRTILSHYYRGITIKQVY